MISKSRLDVSHTSERTAYTAAQASTGQSHKASEVVRMALQSLLAGDQQASVHQMLWTWSERNAR